MSSPIRSAIEPFLKRLKSHLDQVKPIMAKNKILSDAECDLMKLKMKLLRKSIDTLEKKNAQWTKYIQEIHTIEDRRTEETNHNGFKFEDKFFYEWIEEAQTYVDLIEATILSEDKAVPVNQPPAAVNHGHGAKDDTLHISFPKMKLPEFNGDVHEWMTFWQRFDSSVNSRKFRDVDKMELLLGCLMGKAKEAISNIKISNENYDLAVKILKKKYGDEKMLIEKLEAELMNLPTTNEVRLALKKNVDKIEQICRQLKLLDVNVEDNSFLTTIIKSKLPRNVLLNLVTKERESLKKWTTADWRMALTNFVNDRETVFQTMKHFKRDQFGINENVKKDEEKQPRWRDAQNTRTFVVSAKDENKRSSNAEIKDEIAELQEKAAAHEEIAIQFEEFEDEKARLSDENTKLQNKVKVLKELDQIHQSKLSTQKSEIVALQAKLEEVLAEAKMKEFATKKDEEMNIQLKTFSEENLALRNELKALKEVKREQQEKLNTQQIQLETLQANLEQKLKETASKEAEKIDEANFEENTAKLLKREAKCNEKGIIQLILFHFDQSIIDEKCHIKCHGGSNNVNLKTSLINCFEEKISWISEVDVQILSTVLTRKKYILISGIVVLGSLILLIAWKIKPMFRLFKLFSLLVEGSPRGDESTPKWLTKVNTIHPILIEDDEEKIWPKALTVDWPKALTVDPYKNVLNSDSTLPKRNWNEFEEIEDLKFFMQFLKMKFNNFFEKNECPKGMEPPKTDEDGSNQMSLAVKSPLKGTQPSEEIKFNEKVHSDCADEIIRLKSQIPKSDANPELEPPIIWPKRKRKVAEDPSPKAMQNKLQPPPSTSKSSKQQQQNRTSTGPVFE